MSGSTRTIDRPARRQQPHEGMPPLDMSGRQVSFFEFWPGLYFYLPFYVQWVLMGLRYLSSGLPTIANPRFPLGGLVNESKLAILDELAGESRALIATYASFPRSRPDPADAADPDRVEADTRAALRAMQAAGLDFPLVAKPDIGCRGQGVRRPKSEADLRAYIAAFPPGERIILQEWIDLEAEAGVFYVREPDKEKGEIFSLTLKYFPYVFGDGKSTLRELILADPRAGRLPHLYLPRHEARLDDVLTEGEAYRLAFAGSHSRGSIFRNGAAFVTAEMTEAFDRVAKSIPEFYFGRFDVRFTSMEDLQRGRGFRIVEVNGASSEATHIWDRRTTLWQAYRTLWKQFSLLWKIGHQNRRRGHKALPGPLLLWYLYKEKKLTATYPQTE